MAADPNRVAARGVATAQLACIQKTTDRVELWWDSIAARPQTGRRPGCASVRSVRCTAREIGRDQTRAKSYCTMEAGRATDSLGNESHKGYELGENCYRNCGYCGGCGRRVLLCARAFGAGRAGCACGGARRLARRLKLRRRRCRRLRCRLTPPAAATSPAACEGCACPCRGGSGIAAQGRRGSGFHGGCGEGEQRRDVAAARPPRSETFTGKNAWHLQAFAHTQNPLRMVFELDDQFDSYSDAATMTSMQYEMHLSERGQKVTRCST